MVMLVVMMVVLGGCIRKKVKGERGETSGEGSIG